MIAAVYFAGCAGLATIQRPSNTPGGFYNRLVVSNQQTLAVLSDSEYVVQASRVDSSACLYSTRSREQSFATPKWKNPSGTEVPKSGL